MTSRPSGERYPRQRSRGEAIILNAAANIRLETRAFDQAIENYRQALALYRAAGDRRGEGVVLGNLAEASCELGRFDEVFEYAPAALQAARETGNQRSGVLFDALHDPQAISLRTRLSSLPESG